MRAYSIIKVLFASIVVATFFSCTKVIDVDINSKDPLYVVEGFVTHGETTHRLTITKTLDIDESIDFPTVDDATVVLSDDLGNSQNMILVAPGTYEVTGYPVSANRTYSVQVTVGGKVFTASGKMPVEVTLDTLETFPFSFGPSSFSSIVPVRTDPVGLGNYYQFKLIENEMNIPGIYIQSDQYNDGNVMMEPIFADGVDAGDTITVEMYCIEKVIYDYFFTLLQNEQGSTPANPTSNFTGGCLGYFSVRTKSVKQVIIPE